VGRIEAGWNGYNREASRTSCNSKLLLACFIKPGDVCQPDSVNIALPDSSDGEARADERTASALKLSYGPLTLQKQGSGQVRFKPTARRITPLSGDQEGGGGGIRSEEEEEKRRRRRRRRRSPSTSHADGEGAHSSSIAMSMYLSFLSSPITLSSFSPREITWVWM